ncbi:DUF47 family protein [Collinsella sp. AGMB00827]|uniref:DUF47 family protein n=1 Tax=Collinsella ureilytica TaxID=2869515 RepID=A0ABS7MLF4_9ACTN|nr:DUF47 family protein [Collinsella urealyticum]MBY4797920.1 DUF47 family protein [Collinsella urealyticum]
MAKKSDEFYFNTFIKCAEISKRAAQMLFEIMENFDPETIEDALSRMHELENAGDELNHEISDALVSAFITPIEREDIAMLSERLDAVTDHIEGILHRIYFTNVREMRPSALNMAGMIVKACESMEELVRELPRFKRSKTLKNQVVAINTMEGECDELYIESMRRLHTDASLETLEVIAWRDVYTFLEITADSIEMVAETIENVVMKNS